MLSPPLIQTDFDLQSLNTFGIAARARFYIRITRLEELFSLNQIPELAGLPRLILGGGSNIILTDDFPGVVLHMALSGRSMIAEDDQYRYVQAGAGESWHRFVQWTLEQGWGGLENLSLIPGSVGAAPIQNIGAYGVELKDYFQSLNWYEFSTGQIRNLTDPQFSYRDSVFKHGLRDRGVILNVTFALPKQWQPHLGYGDVATALQGCPQPTPQQISRAICAIRQSKLPDPGAIGNVGSFFKNPAVSAAQLDVLRQACPDIVSYAQADGRFKLAAGWLIERAGWRGYASGRVGVYAKQALVLINAGGATGADVVALADRIMADVQQRFGVDLEIEPVFV